MLGVSNKASQPSVYALDFLCWTLQKADAVTRNACKLLTDCGVLKVLLEYDMPLHLFSLMPVTWTNCGACLTHPRFSWAVNWVAEHPSNRSLNRVMDSLHLSV